MTTPDHTFGDIAVTIDESFVATVEIQRPPHNFSSLPMIYDLASAFEFVDDAPGALAILLAAKARTLCWRRLRRRRRRALIDEKLQGRHLYDEAVRLFSCQTPVVAAVQGAAIGGGLGVAAAADFRVGGPGTRMAANFARLGFHHGFGLTVTLPAIVGQQAALRMLYTGELG
ncbi:MAG: enoyl-CoA hydratase-related protein [Acidimicrobiales bacterium]